MRFFSANRRAVLLRFTPGFFVLGVLLLHASNFFPLATISQLENWCYDLRLNLTLEPNRDARIVILDIDEKSLAEEGHWPWSRNRMALLLNQLFDVYQIAVVGFDIVFSEKDQSSGLPVLETLARTSLRFLPEYSRHLNLLRPQLDYDRLFAEAMTDRPVVLGYYFSDSQQDRRQSSGVLPAPVFSAGTFANRAIPFVSMSGFGGNLPEFQEQARSAGHFLPYTDADGKCRRIPMLVEYQGNYYEALSLAVVRTLLWDPPLMPGFPSSNSGGDAYKHLEWLELADLKIPVDARVTALIPFRGQSGSYVYISAADVLHNRVDKARLENAIVLVGTTAPGLMDQRATPVASVYPGVEIHANMIAGILDGSILSQPSWVMGAEMTALLGVGLVLIIFLPLLGPVGGVLLTLVCLSGVLTLNGLAWRQHLVLPLASGLALILFLYVWNMTCGFLIEARHKRRITGLFGQYVPPELVAEMSENPDSFTTEAENRELTVLFSDIRGFTSLSEALAPKELAQIMNEYMTLMTRVIHRHRGTIDKYIGDAIMAFWGAPLSDTFHANNALLAALEMQHELRGLRQRFATKNWPQLKSGIGLNTGLMSVGNMGSEFRMAYTVLGDAVNLGSRLEGLCSVYGVEILVSEATRNSVSGVLFREIDRVRVKGKEQPVIIYQPLGQQDGITTEKHLELEQYQQALNLYKKQDWPKALQAFQSLHDRYADETLYKIYLDRLVYFSLHPPKQDWDGIFAFDHK
jgi:adenylate cyclase